MSIPGTPETKDPWLVRFAWGVCDWFGKSHDVPRVTLKPDSEEVSAAIVAHVLSRPDSIRQRAQSAATISGALAAGLVVAAVSSLTSPDRPLDWLITAVVCAAILCFALSAVLSVYAVAFPHEYQGATTKEVDYQGLVRDYETYADEVRQKMRRAAAAAFVAVSLTAGALVLELVARATADEAVIVLVSPDGREAVQKLCPRHAVHMPKIAAKAPPEEFVKPMVTLTEVEPAVPAVGQDSLPACGTITLPRGAIRAVYAAKK